MSRQFGETLRELAGDQYQKMTDGLAEVVAAAMATGRVGEITVKLKIRPTNANAVQVECDVKTKVPVKPAHPTIFFVANGDSLVRTDPNQMALPLKPVAPAPMAAPMKQGAADMQAPTMRPALVSDGPAPMKQTSAG